MASDAIDRAELLAAIALRSGEFRALQRILDSCDDDLVFVRLNAKVEELGWLAELVVRWGTVTALVKGGVDGD